MLKTFRDIRETIGSFISILVVIFIGCFFFAGIVAASTAVSGQVDDYYVSQSYASARGEYMYVNSAAVEEIASAEGVTAAAGYDTFYTKARINGVRYDATITTLTDGIDVPYLTTADSRMPAAGQNEILVDTVFAEKHNVKIGDGMEFNIRTVDSITVSTDPVSYTPHYTDVNYVYTICGIYHLPDTIFKVNMKNTAAQPDEFVMACVNHGEISPFTEGATVDTVISMGENKIPISKPIPRADGVEIFTGIKIKGDADIDGLFDKYNVDEEFLKSFFDFDPQKPFDPTAPAGLYMYSLDRKSFPSVKAYSGINDTIAALAAVLPFMFFAVAAAITIISLSKTVDNQRMQIGVIQALGVSKGSVYFSYIFYALFACVIGGFAGGVVGTFTVPYLLQYVYELQFCMPPTSMHIGILYMFLGVVISAALACLSAFISCHHTLKVVPAQAMRPKPPKKTKKILAERWTGLWKRLGFGAKMNLRNMFLHKMRMLLSSVGIIGCLALLIGLIGLKDNMAHSFASYDASTGYDMTIITEDPVDITREDVYTGIDGAPGEEYMHNLTFVPVFSGEIKLGDKTADTAIMAIPTYADEKHYRFADADCIRLYRDLSGKDRIYFRSDTFVLPQMLADEIGAKVGDTVKVSGYSLVGSQVDFEITVTDIAYEYFEQKVYCAYDVFKDNKVGLYADTSYATLLPWADEKAALDALSGNDAVRDVKTFTDTFDALKKQMSLLDYAVILFVMGAAVLAVAVIYNITATNLKERTREIATLMVLGYKKNETASMIIVENLVITGLGCLLGLPLGYGLLLWLADLSVSFRVFITDFLSWYVALGCIGLTFVFSLIATMFLNRKMKKISMVEALKSVE